MSERERNSKFPPRAYSFTYLILIRDRCATGAEIDRAVRFIRRRRHILLVSVVVTEKSIPRCSCFNPRHIKFYGNREIELAFCVL